MTTDRNIKKRARALQKETGEPYTSALARMRRVQPILSEVRQSLSEIDLSKPIVYRVEAMGHTSTRRNEVYRQEGATKLLMDVQMPPGLAAGARLPAVFFIHGGPIPPDMMPPTQWGIFQSYAALAAASGLVGVTFNHRLHGPTDYAQSQSDIAAAVDYVRTHATELHVDPERIALWYFSGGGPQLSWVLRERPSFVRCVLAFYALLDLRHMLPPGTPAALVEQVTASSPAALVKTRAEGLPMFVARAGLDAAFVNDSVDLFVREALAANTMLDLVTHPTGHHTFDVQDDDERTREIITRAIAFAQTHLGSWSADEFRRVRPSTS